MSKLNKIERGEIRVVYLELDDNFGFYRVRPGKEPFIALNEKLLEGGENVHLTVYRTLLEYHHSIPLDSMYRCFPLTRFFKELIPLTSEEFIELTVTASATEPGPGPEIIIFARAPRQWHFPIYLPDNFRMIG